MSKQDTAVLSPDFAGKTPQPEGKNEPPKPYKRLNLRPGVWRVFWTEAEWDGYLGGYNPLESERTRNGFA